MTKDEAKIIISSTFSSEFNEKNFQNFAANLFKKYTSVEKIVDSRYVRHLFHPYVEEYKIKGYFEDNEGNKIDILQVALKGSTVLKRARTAQRNFVADYLKNNNKEAALVAFVSPEKKDWRLSLVKLEHSLEVADKRLKTIEEVTPAKRWSFLVGEHEGSHTAQSRFIKLLISDEDLNLAELELAFGIESVTDEFFNKYKELYFKLKDHLDELLEKDETLKKDFKDKEITTVDFAKKTLGQIVFLYFLQKKGWFGVKANEEWGEGNKVFMRRLFDWRKEFSDYKGNFFNDILEPLFYEGLSSDLGNDNIYDRLSFKGQKYKMPFLNGGLFSPINEYLWKTTEIKLSEEIFSNKKDENDEGTGIFDVFDLYNFTVNENEPLEKEVAVDPEMLGKVFENLLDIKDRKSKGSFYTPREIVHYMCQESLINYLETGTKNDISREDLEFFIHKGDGIIENDKITLEKIKEKESKGYKFKSEYYKLLLPDSIRSKAGLLSKLLQDIKVADPAVGSGAFPLGMINEIVRARKVLNIYLDEKESDYDLKLHTISHSIHGVDIDPGAVEIAKLRLWLSLVVDDVTPHPLPNLEHKIMQGNSLISEYEGIKLFDESIFEKEENKEKEQGVLGLGKTSIELKTENLQHKIKLFISESQKSKKQELKKEIDSLKWELIETTLKEQGKQDKLNDIKKLRNRNICPFFIWKLEFSDVFKDKGGFDVVIGNPPYGETVSLNTESLRSLYRSTEGKFEIYKYFIERAFNLINSVGIIALITPDTWLTLGYFNKIRRIVLTESSVLQISNTIDKAFDSATVNTVVFILKKGQSSNKTLLVSDKLFNKIEIVDFYDSDYIINLKQRDVIIKKLDGLSTRLGNKTEVTQGLIAYASRKQDRSWTTKIKKSEIHRKILYGREISRFSINWQGDYLKYGDWLHRKRPSYVFDKPKIFIQRIRNPKLKNRLIAALDYDGYLATNGLSIILAIDNGPNIELITGILNSKLINYWFGFHYKDVNIKPAQLRTIPLPDNVSSNIATLIVDVVKEVSKKDKDADIKNFESQIDKMVYDLYGLTKEEIKIIESKI